MMRSSGTLLGRLRQIHANNSLRLGSVRFMGVGSWKEGNRAGQHGVHYPHAKADGSPEKAEADAREEFLEKAKAASNNNNNNNVQAPPIGDEEGEAAPPTELQFGVKDGKTTDEAITRASEQLFERSTINAKSSESAEAIKEADKRKYPGELTSDVSSPDGNDEASAAGEMTRGNIGKTRNEMSDRRAWSPQTGVRVGNVTSVGANARENEGDEIPQFSEEQQSTGGEILDRAQGEYEQAVSGFGTQDGKNRASSQSN